MALIDIDLNPDERTLRSFGWIALGGFGFLAAIAWLEWLVFSFGLGAARLPLTIGFAAVGAIAALLSLVAPKANRWLFVGLALITFPIGFVLSYAIMGLLFFGIITPAGLLLRVFGRDPLERRWLPSASTYWVDARRERPKSSYFKQF